MGCSAQKENFHGYISTRLGPFFSARSRTIDWKGNQPARWGTRGEAGRKGSFPAIPCLLRILFTLKLISPLQKANPEMKGHRRKLGSSRGQEERERERHMVQESGLCQVPNSRSAMCQVLSKLFNLFYSCSLTHRAGFNVSIQQILMEYQQCARWGRDPGEVNGCLQHRMNAPRTSVTCPTPK